ncbi:FprA family A-type flavoprotein, partial [Alistipes putredinis]|uniref:FprA family A-type flavoprotein n=1 Tax=Alistipes putredinis TaxID=28117 RepID=UPI003AB1C2C3
LFEGLWPLPLGVSYNAYLVCGERTALVDTVDACFTGRLLANVRERLGDRPLDYLVINHMEPDHSASIAAVRQAYPAVRIVGNAKTLQMIEGYYGIACGTVEVKEGDVLDLGGLTLAFCMIPMVHWPETMATWCAEERTIFSGDAFGTFGALNGGVTDEQLDVEPFWEEMRRYYACIVGKYGAPVQKALQKLSGLPIETICSTHGPVWQQEIGRVIGIYDQLSRYEGEPGVVIAYGSMYGNTAQMAEKIARELAVQGVKNIIVYNLSYADISNVIRDIFKYDTLIVGSPTYNGELFPEVGSLLQKISERCIPCRKFAYFGSYTWAGAAVRLLGEFAQKMKWEAICQPTEMKQGYDDQGAQCCTALAKAIAEKIR